MPRFVGMIGVAVVALTFFAFNTGASLAHGGTSGDGVVPTVIPGANNEGKTCSGGTDGDNSSGVAPGTTMFKLEGALLANSPPTFTDGTLVITISNLVLNGTDKIAFDWSSNIPVEAVVVKDGNDGANLYDYDPADTGDTGLTTPHDHKNISHINFCYLASEDPQASVEVTKTAETSWTIDCTWNVEKDGPSFAGVPDESGEVEVDYTITVDADCVETITVSGTISVENTGDTRVRIDAIADELGGDLDCVPDLAGLPIVLLVGGSIECTYEIDFASIEEVPATNTVTVDWTGPGMVAFESTNDPPADTNVPDEPTVTNACVIVIDIFNGGPPRVVDAELCYTETLPAEYTVTITFTAEDCGQSFTNVAQVRLSRTVILDEDEVTTSVACLGRTQGFWGNKNGVARIIAEGGYAVNAVNIGRGADINTQGESQQVLPSTHDACGNLKQGSKAAFASVFAIGGGTPCTTNISEGTLNNLASQTLALGYNIALVDGYAGQTVEGLGCGAGDTRTVEEVFDDAVALVDGSVVGGTTTQAQAGAMTDLLGCLNREA